MRTLKNLLGLCIAAYVLTGCSSSAPLSKRDNFSYLYGKGSAQMPLHARVHHIGNDRSRVYYKLNTSDLLYKSDGTGGPFHAVVRISYESYDAFGSKVLLDSASTVIDDASSSPSEERELIGSMDLRRNERRSFVLKVMARDLNRDVETTVFLRVDRDGGIPATNPLVGQAMVPACGANARPENSNTNGCNAPLYQTQVGAPRLRACPDARECYASAVIEPEAARGKAEPDNRRARHRSRPCAGHARGHRRHGRADRG